MSILWWTRILFVKWTRTIRYLPCTDDLFLVFIQTFIVASIQVTKNEYDMCNINQLNINPTTRILIACNSPYEVMKYTLNFRSYLPIPNGLEFHSNQTYYFLSTTSSLSSSNQPCYKLKINVHEHRKSNSRVFLTRQACSLHNKIIRDCVI